MAKRPGKLVKATGAIFAAAATIHSLSETMSMVGDLSLMVARIAAVLLAGAVLWFAAAWLKAVLKVENDGPVGGDDVDPEPPGLPDYFTTIIDSVEGARRLTLDVTSKVFPTTSIPLGVVEQAQARNNRRLVALIERASGDTVGWATVWPVTAEAGRAVESGARPDDELVLADLLAAAQNREAAYLVVLAVGIVQSHRNLPGGVLPRTLGKGLLWHMHDEFFADDSAQVTIVAIGDTPAGRRMCEAIGLAPNGAHCKFANVADPKPVYSAKLTRPHLRQRIRDRFGD